MDADLCFKFSKSRWLELSPGLDNNDESAWTEAIGVFERRMKERFFSCVDALERADTKPDQNPSELMTGAHCIPGFAIMALCCLLVETLQGFREGSTSRVAIQSFLARPSFQGSFSGKIAREFTDGIRNGILHDAETRHWVIRRNRPIGKIASPQDDGYALNRTLFYSALKQEFEAYLTELRDSANRTMREKFKTKMDRLCKQT